MKIGIVAGEASGDQLGANLLRALRTKFPDLTAEGVGGEAMQREGFHSLFEMERLSVMGLFEPIKHLPDLFKLRGDLLNHFKKNPPDVFIGIDAPDFNLGLEIKLKQLGIRTVHYVSPSVWAWRRRRLSKISRAVDLMLTLFPFEEKFYQQHGIPVKCVGHPLAEKIPLFPQATEARHRLGLDGSSRYIALLPGSRQAELRYMSEPFLRAAVILYQRYPDIRFITSHVNAEREQIFLSYQKQVAPSLPLHSFVRQTHDVMQASTAVIVTSGTATLETMLYKKPMVIAYRMSGFTHWLARRLVKIPRVGLPNLLAGELLVPELIQDEASPEKIVEAISLYLDNPDNVTALIERYTQLHVSLKLPTESILLESLQF